MTPTSLVRSGLVLVALASVSCSSPVREGTGSSFLILTVMEGASGAEPDAFSAVLHSDVQTVVEDVPTIFSDSGRASFQLGLKDPGTASSPNQPTQNQFITLERYRVRFIRADGRNTPGVDVPYGFDGALTLTVTGSASTAFELVRHIAKQEAPLGALVRSAVVISTIAEVTFFGRDQTGHEVSVTGRITVDFGNFGDPQ